MKWSKVCRPISEGGFGLRRLKDINKWYGVSLILKINGHTLLRKVQKEMMVLGLEATMVVLKWVLDDLKENMRWQVGNGVHISV